MSNNEINALVPGRCPHCGEEIVVKLKVIAPELIEILNATEAKKIIAKLNPPQNENDTPKDPDTE